MNKAQPLLLVAQPLAFVAAIVFIDSDEIGKDISETFGT